MFVIFFREIFRCHLINGALYCHTRLILLINLTSLPGAIQEAAIQDKPRERGDYFSIHNKMIHPAM